MKRRILSCVVIALLLLAVPCTASAKVQEGATTEITASCNLPEILVTVPATAQVFINPYEMPVEIDGASLTEQIVSTPAAIENKSEVPLSVTVTLTGKVDTDSDMRLVTSSTKGGSSWKYAFIYFEAQAVSNPNQVVWDSEFDEEKHIVLRDGEGRPRENMVTIAQADQADHFCAFRLTGDCVPAPRDPWTESDQLKVSIMFTFVPLYRQDA